MYKSTGKLEEFLWEQVRSNSEIIGAAWIEKGEIRAQALRNDFDMFLLQQFIRRSISQGLSDPYIITYEIGSLIGIPAEKNAILVFETTREFRGNYRRPSEDKSPYIFINPDMGFGFA